MVNTANFNKAMKAALDGPEVKKVKIEKHEFNVKKATVTRSRAEGTMVSGHISHHLSFRDDDQVKYKCRITAGQAVTIDQIEVDIDRSIMNKFLGDLLDIVKDFFEKKLEERFTTQALATRSEDAERRIYDEAKKLLDGSWEGEAQFLMVNIVGRLAIREAQHVVFRQTGPGPRRPSPVVRDHRTKTPGTTRRTSTP